MTDQLTRLLTLILLGFALTGCIHEQIEVEPPLLDLDAGLDPDMDSAVDDLTPGVVLDTGEFVPSLLSIDELAYRIETARKECDYQRYRRFRDQLQEGANKEKNDILDAGGDPFEDPRIQRMSDLLQKYPRAMNCGGADSATAMNGQPWTPEGGTDGSLYDGDYSIGFTRATLLAGYLNVPVSTFLGTENAGLDRRLGIVETDDDDRIVGASVSGAFWTGWTLGKYPIGLYFSAYRATADIGQEFETIDPNGLDLLIPGPEGGASGFNLTGVGNLNGVTNAMYHADYDWHGFRSKIRTRIPVGSSQDTYIAPYIGVSYGGLETDFRFMGMIPGFARDFDYRTDVDVDTISPIVGFGAFGKLGGSLDWIGWRLNARASADFNDAEGRDTLSFTGFPDSSVALENDDTTFGYSIGAGLTFGVDSPFHAGLGLTYMRTDNVPVVTRDGTNPSRLELEEAESVQYRFSVGFRF